MKDIFERKKIKLTVKSPVHIGSVDQKITRFEYIQSGQFVYQVSEERLSRFLQKVNLIDSYISAVSREGNRFRLLDFLNQKRINLKENHLIDLSGHRRSKLVGDASQLTEYKPFIRDGFNNVFIPGTSIKGVFRTAILYTFLSSFRETNPQIFQQTINDKISKDIDFRKEKRIKNKNLFEWGIKKWFEGFKLSDSDITQSPHTDWLRMLHISDAYSSGDIETILIPVNVLKKETHGWQYKRESSGNTTIWVECIPENIVLEFEASWDKNLLDEFKKANNQMNLPKNIDEVMKNISKCSNDVIRFEKEFTDTHDLQKWYKNNTSNFRIGFGSGMTSTTIIMLLPDNLRKKIRNFAGKDKRDDIAPKSRRVWLKNNLPTPLGWAVLEMVG